MEKTVTDIIDSLLAWKAVIIPAWLVLFFILERLRPAEPYPRGAGVAGWRRVARNVAVFAPNSMISVGMVVPVSAFAAAHGLGLRPGFWQGAPGLVLDILALDLWIYWWHRANHEIGFLWRFHEIHHLDRFLDSTSAIRFHFAEVMLSALVRAPVILLLGIPLSSVLFFELLVMLAAMFHHSNLRLPPPLEAALSRVVITPAIHWVHHHAIRRDTDSNYGTIFSFWDRMFRSKSRTRRFAGMPIGVEGAAETSWPRLLLRPFDPRRRAARPGTATERPRPPSAES